MYWYSSLVYMTPNKRGVILLFHLSLSFMLCLQVISAGLRVGWITGAKPIIDRLSMDQQSNVMQASTLSQVRHLIRTPVLPHFCSHRLGEGLLKSRSHVAHYPPVMYHATPQLPLISYQNSNVLTLPRLFLTMM